MIPKIAISIGDPNGIGPEIVIRLLNQIRLEQVSVILAGRSEVLAGYSGISVPQCPGYTLANEDDEFDAPGVYLVTAGEHDFTPTPGKINALSGQLSMQCVALGIRLCLSGRVHALVTAPISKEAIHLGGYNVPGHTEFLASRTGADHILMMMVSDTMRVAFATTHVPLRDVADSLNRELILKRLDTLNKSLSYDFGIRLPNIAVLGLNPHAGDGGIIGHEEHGIITPALKQARTDGILAEGPFPADAFFARRLYTKFDAVLAMYHDQGLIPFKSTDDGKGVNFTAGLPIIRTSPDHGTAFDIAGTGKADPSSIEAAFDLALKLVVKMLSRSKQL